ANGAIGPKVPLTHRIDKLRYVSLAGQRVRSDTYKRMARRRLPCDRAGPIDTTYSQVIYAAVANRMTANRKRGLPRRTLKSVQEVGQWAPEMRCIQGDNLVNVVIRD